MNRPYLFLAGEFQVSMPLCFSRMNWSHTMTPKKLIPSNNGIKREGVHEDITGVIYYNRANDYNLEVENLNFLINSNTYCWPDPKLLLELGDRHKVLGRCVEAGFVNHWVEQGDRDYLISKIPENQSVVIKTGQEHRGEGKYLITVENRNVPEFNGIASMESFFIGDSCRVLLIGDDSFLIKYDNPDSWIKNSAGADIIEATRNVPKKLLDNARKINEHFGLEINGIDYIVYNDDFHFLEINQYPGIGVSDEIMDVAKSFLSKKMDLVESRP